ncbi:PstS family phosphate ABC transporter substrate-binding protein [Lusitaniella coriacea]|uniref:PstS family phosphate ABC transporter substrate-binding protein n=1 Tax=Lusitaniella coriacea TaxID=1983105 RepID=UPI003CF8CE1C
MSQKNETLPLVLALLMTVGILGGGFWWFTRHSNSPIANSQNPKPSKANTSSNTTTTQTFAQVKDVPRGLYNYGGSTTWAPIRKELDSAIQTVYPQFQLRYTQPTISAPGSSTGIKMLLNGQLDFAQSSRALKEPEYRKAQQKGFTLKEIPIALDAIVVAVHPDLDIPGLTVTQLKEIYTGKISNWNQVGGRNLPILAYSRRLGEGGTIGFFADNVLGGETFSGNVRFIGTTTQALREVTNNPGGIYFASAPEVVPQCGVKSLPLGRTAKELVTPYDPPFVPLNECPARRNQVNGEAFQDGTYPITRRLFVIVKQNEQEDEQAGEAYAKLLLTNQGQELIRKTGFVRIR